MKIVLLILALRFIKTRGSNLFVPINDCTCQGYNVTYECTVFGNGATIWKGTVFDCSLTDNELAVFHTINFTSQRPLPCNNGAIIGHAVRAENGSYTSQITIQVSDEFNGTTVVCAHDNGTDTIEIGSAIITTDTAPFPPPTDVQLIEVNHKCIRFNWSHVSSRCPSLQYHIMADNCGECPSATTTNMATCTGDYKRLTSDRPCSFAVRSAVCSGIIGDFSIAVNVAMAGTGTGPTDSKASSDPYGAFLLRIVIALGAVIGAMLIVIIFITLLFTTVMFKSKRALRLEIDLLQAKIKEQPVIYEEIAQLQDSLKSSSPPIDVGENTAYVSAVCMNACARISK